MHDRQSLALPVDPVEQIPEPEIVNAMLAEAIRRADLLRAMLRIARRKAAYRPRSHAESQGGAA